MELEDCIAAVTDPDFVFQKHQYIHDDVQQGRPADEPVVVFTSYAGEPQALSKLLKPLGRDCFIIDSTVPTAGAKRPLEAAQDAG